MTREEARRILGVGILATEAELKNAFRNAAKKFHPDVSTQEGDDQKFIDAHQAFEILMNRQKAESQFTKKNTENKFRNQTRYSTETKSANNYYSNTIFDERRRNAWQTAQELEEQMSQQIYHSVFDEYMNGNKRKILKFFAGIFLLVFVFLSYDRLADPVTKYKDKSQYELLLSNNLSQTYYLKHNRQIVQIERLSFVRLLNSTDKIIITETPFLHEIAQIKNSKGEEIEFERNYQFFNLYTLFPFYQLFFLIPFLAFFFEKPSFNFLFFGVYGSLYAVPLYFLIIMIHQDRFLRILGI